MPIAAHVGESGLEQRPQLPVGESVERRRADDRALQRDRPRADVEHPQGLMGILGDGGPWAMPASVVVGGVLAVGVRGGRAHVDLRSRRHRGGRAAQSARCALTLVGDCARRAAGGGRSASSRRARLVSARTGPVWRRA